MTFRAVLFRQKNDKKQAVARPRRQNAGVFPGGKVPAAPCSQPGDRREPPQAHHPPPRRVRWCRGSLPILGLNLFELTLEDPIDTHRLFVEVFETSSEPHPGSFFCFRASLELRLQRRAAGCLAGRPPIWPGEKRSRESQGWSSPFQAPIFMRGSQTMKESGKRLNYPK